MTGLLFSGGLDSTSILFWKKPDMSIYINYGQRNYQGELRAVKIISKEMNIPVEIITINCRKIGAGILSEESIDYSDSKSEWWPFRNQFLITVAVMKAFKNGIHTILIGSVSEDKIYKDGTASFIRKINNLISYQEGAIKIKAPAIKMTTLELIKKSQISVSLLSWAHSCNNSSFACGYCVELQKEPNYYGCIK